MTYPTYSLLTRIYWTTGRSIPLSPADLTQFLDILNGDPAFESFIPKFTGITTQNSLVYYNSFTGILNNNDFVTAADNVTCPNNVRDAIEYVLSYRTTELTQYCIDSIFAVLNAYPEFAPYAARLEGITPETTMDYYNGLYYLFELPQFILDIEGYVIS